MIDAIALVDTAARAAAVIRFRIPPEALPSVMPAAVEELRAVLAAQGLAPAGPPFNHYLRMTAAEFEFEAGVPVERPVRPSGRVVPGTLPAARVARAVYTGPYDRLHHVWAEFGRRVRDGGHSPAPGLWECYVSGPEADPDPATWRTELNQPLTPPGPDSPRARRTERVLPAGPRAVLAAFEQPEQLARWWGPDGFTNTFERFEFRPGGAWVFTMHGPTGTDHANASVFHAVGPDRVVIEHVSPPHFTLTVTLAARGDRTHLTWVQEFDTPEIAAGLRPLCEPANEQNLDRLEALLAGPRP